MAWHRVNRDTAVAGIGILEIIFDINYWIIGSSNFYSSVDPYWFLIIVRAAINF